MISEENYRLLIKWLNIHNNGRNTADYLKRKNIKKVAIYGMGDLGIILYDELIRGGIEISYVIDKNADLLNLDIDSDVKSPDDDFCKVDAIIVTSLVYFDEIRSIIENKVPYKILSIETMIDDA